MHKRHHNWIRFWLPRGDEVALEDSLLADPETEPGRFLNHKLVPSHHVAEKRCTILLGEPGMGKSTELKRIVELLSRAAGAAVLQLDLNAIGSESSLKDDLFRHPKALEWQKGSHDLAIVLDSFDECMLKVDTLSNRLGKWLREQQEHLDRLRLVISCRTARWPQSLESAIKASWSEESVGAFELMPLRRIDVELACRDHGVDSKFLEAVDARDIWSFTARPLTLSLLLAQYREKSGQLPSSRTELYQQGILELTRELNPSRRERNLDGVLTAQQRYRFAARIAGVMQLCGKTQIHQAAGSPSPETIALDDLYGDEDGRQVTHQELREVLDTGLFTARGETVLGWAHQSYADFLSAEWLCANEVPEEQLESLLTDETGVLPQLSATAAWVVSMRPEVASRLLKEDPSFVLQGEPEVLDSGTKASIVEQLLQAHDANEVTDRWAILQQRPGRLKHPELADQLRSWITDKIKGEFARGLAIRIAEDAGELRLRDAFLELALDLTDHQYVRRFAVQGLAKLGSDDELRVLRTLLEEPALDVDPSDDVFGATLRALWPRHLSPEELFSRIRHPKDSSYLGVYHHFLLYDFPANLPDTALSAVLDWIAKASPTRPAPSALDEAKDRALCAVAERVETLEEMDLASKFAKTVLARREAGGDLRVADSRNNRFLPRIRLKIIQTVINHLTPDQVLEVFQGSSFVNDTDFDWIADELEVENEGDGDTVRCLCRVLAQVWDQSSRDQNNKILRLASQNRVVEEEFAASIRPIGLNSTRAQTIREGWIRAENRKRKQEIPLEVIDEHRQSVRRLLEQFEKGDLTAWNALCVRVRGFGRTANTPELNPDWSHLPGWNLLENADQSRLVAHALEYLIQWQPDYSSFWQENGNFLLNSEHSSGYDAFSLLCSEKTVPVLLDDLPSASWTSWVRVILALADIPGAIQELPSAAYKVAPEPVLREVAATIQRASAANQRIYLLDQFETVWDERLEETLSLQMKREGLAPRTFGDLLRRLLSRSNQPAKSLAIHLTAEIPVLGENAGELNLVAAAVLLYFADAETWPIVWEGLDAARHDRKLFIEIYTGLADLAPPPSLDRKALGQLYLWLLDHVPVGQDPEDPGEAEWSTIHPWNMLRDAVLDRIMADPAEESCAVLQRICDARPDLPWLRSLLAQVQQRHRKSTWSPPSPSELLELIRSSDRRLVRSGDHLLTVALESLQRYEQRLHGEGAVVARLWNEVRTGKKSSWQPKQESDLSNDLRDHLDMDLKKSGILSSREVNIRSTAAAGRGEDIDIHVDVRRAATSRGPAEHFKLIIEVKGCWNRDLKTDMARQLRDRYLAESDCRHGLYVVGWFPCDRWAADDYRKDRAPKWSLEEARQFFETQAAELTSAPGSPRIKSFVLDARLRNK